MKKSEISRLLHGPHQLTIVAVFSLILFFFQQSKILSTDPLWVSHQFPHYRLWYVIGLLSFFLCSSAICSRLLNPVQHVLALSGLALTCLIGFQSSKIDSVFFLIEATSALGISIAGRNLLAKILRSPPPLWLGFLFGALLLHHVLFVLTLCGMISAISTTIAVAMIALPGLLTLCARPSDFMKSFLPEEPFSTPSALLLWAIIITTCLSFVTSSLPQTYTDGLVYRLPYLKALASEGAMPHHNYLWAWLIPQAATLQMLPGYFLYGELGANWTVIFFFIALSGLTYDLGRALGASTETALASVLMVISIPCIWLLSAILYNDIQIAAYGLGGLILLFSPVLKVDVERTELQKHLALGAMLVGFSASIKLNAPVVAGIVFLTVFCGMSGLRRSTFRNLPVLAVGFLAGASPWYVWVYTKTGNPFYPFLNKLFGSQFADVDMGKKALEAFAFKPSVQTYLWLPWDLTFATSKFGEYPNGVFGPALVLIAFLLIATILLKGRHLLSGAPLKWPEFYLIIAYFPAFWITSHLVQGTHFRYSILALTGFIVASTALLERVWKTRLSTAHATILSTLCLGFLVVIGTRLNYAGDLGDEVFFGPKTKRQYIQQQTRLIDSFINKSLKEDETVLASQFYHLHRFDHTAFHVANKNSLFGKVAELESAKDFIKEHNVAYWVVDLANPPDFFAEKNFSKHILKPEKIVFGNGNFVVFNLREKRKQKDESVTLSELEWNQNKPHKNLSIIRAAPETHAFTEQIIEPRSYQFASGTVEISNSTAHATVIIDIIFKKGSSELSRSIASRTLNKTQTLSLPFFSTVPAEATSILLIVRPWRESDGTLELVDASMKLVSNDNYPILEDSRVS